jgi:sRNA-binding carbon storage regulator CsrA
MTLVLTRRLGEDFYVGDDQVILEEIHSQTEISLRRTRDASLIRLRQGEWFEISPGVSASVAARGQLGLARIAFEGSESVPIWRGDLYRQLTTKK